MQYLINQDGRTSRYGQPVYVMQVREEDMGGEFRVGLLNHATFDEIQDGSQKFVECTWVKGYTPDSIKGTADRVVRGEKHRALSGGLSGMDGRYGILKPTKV